MTYQPHQEGYITLCKLFDLFGLVPEFICGGFILFTYAIFFEDCFCYD